MMAEAVRDLWEREPEWNPLASAMKSAVAPIRVRAGEVVVRQGDEGQHLYLVDEGALAVVCVTQGVTWLS